MTIARARKGLSKIERIILHSKHAGYDTALLESSRDKLMRIISKPLIVYKNRGFLDPCCNKEDRSMSGGCLSCGDPCL